jgi:hypothetical protein
MLLYLANKSVPTTPRPVAGSFMHVQMCVYVAPPAMIVDESRYHYYHGIISRTTSPLLSLIGWKPVFWATWRDEVYFSERSWPIEESKTGRKTKARTKHSCLSCHASRG